MYMKKLYFIFSGLFVAAMILFSSPLMAVGLGVYLTGQGGSYSCSPSDSTYDSFDLSTSEFGIGFVLDTTVAKDKIFNYRLNIELTNISATPEDGDSFSGVGFNIFNTFGFGVVRKEKVRLWIGPQIGFGYFYADTTSTYYSSYYGYESYTTSVDGVRLSIGPMVGLNINLGPVVSLCFDTGFRVSSIFGGVDTYDEYIDFSGSGVEFVAHAGVIFRIHDKYEQD